MSNCLPFNHPPPSPLTAQKWKVQKNKKIKNHDQIIYFSWDMAHDGCNCYISFWAVFALLPSLTAQKIKVSENKKVSGDIIILHNCTKNHDHMLYCSWHMTRDRCNYFSSWAIFCPFTPITARKIKISQKWKKLLDISSFHTSLKKIVILCYSVPEIWPMTDIIVTFHFGLIFAINENFKKM